MYVETSEKMESGLSGEPIINEAGELVGIVSWAGEYPIGNARFYSSLPSIRCPVFARTELCDTVR